MNYILYLQSSAIQDLKDAYLWYEEKQLGLGDRFLAEVDIFLTQIELKPLIFPIIFQQKRRAVLRKFPYIIVFSIEDGFIRVSAVMHTGKDPVSWMKRK